MQVTVTLDWCSHQLRGRTCGVFKPSNQCAISTTQGYICGTEQTLVMGRTNNDAVVAIMSLVITYNKTFI